MFGNYAHVSRQVVLLFVLACALGCDVSRTYQQLVPVNAGDSLEENRRIAAKIVNDATLANIKRSIRAEHPSILDTQMERLALQFVDTTTYSPDGSSRQSVNVRIVVEEVSPDAELLLDSAVAAVERLVRQSAAATGGSKVSGLFGQSLSEAIS